MNAIKARRIMSALVLSLTLTPAALLTFGCGGSSPAVGLSQEQPQPAGRTGIAIHAQIINHLQKGYPLNPAPAANTTLLIEPAGSKFPVATVITDANGNFSVTLPPGSYTIVPQLTPSQVAAGLAASPVNITITSGEFSQVVVNVIK